MIGDITDDFVYILLVSDKEDEEKITLKLFRIESDESLTKIKTKMYVVKYSKIVKISGIEKNHKYMIDISSDTRESNNTEHLHFHTNPIKKIAIVSCDFPQMDVEDTLWNNVFEYSPDICIHIGDNIYGDETFVKCQKLKKSSLIEEKYRKKYFKTWSRWSAKLNTSSHIFTWDDHDVSDGFYIGKFEPNTRDDKIAKIAVGLEQAYNPTQKMISWNRECYANNGILSESEFGVVWKQIDNRTMLVLSPRMYCKNEPFRKELFDPLHSVLENFDRLLLCFTAAPVPRASGIPLKVYEDTFGLDGLMTNDRVIELYDWIFEWLEAKKGRQILLFGGDIHIGIKVSVQNEKGTSFDTYVSSPVSNAPTIMEQIYAHGLNDIKSVGNYKVNIEASARRNYVEVDMDNFKAKHVWSSDIIPKNAIDSFLSLIKMKYSLF